MSESPLLQQLIEALRCLPGVGPKSAQRMAFHILERDREGGRHLSRILSDAVERIGRCQQCRTLTERTVCRLCDNPERDTTRLCIVESPSDVMAIEQATDYRGRYFVLHGRLSPLDGVGPKELGLTELEQRLAAGGVDELILALTTTVEGEATAHYVGQLAARSGIETTRIAHGVPLGGELEYVDGGTLAHAFAGRTRV